MKIHNNLKPKGEGGMSKAALALLGEESIGRSGVGLARIASRGFP